MSFRASEILLQVQGIERSQESGYTDLAMTALDVIIEDLSAEFDTAGPDLRALLLACQLGRSYKYVDTSVLRDLMMAATIEQAEQIEEEKERSRERTALLRKPITIPANLSRDGVPVEITTKQSMEKLLAQVYGVITREDVIKKYNLSGGKHQKAQSFLKQHGVEITREQLRQYAPKTP